MEGDDLHDPYFWDEERLIRELCHSNRRWKARPPNRPLDLTALEVKLREGGVDGASFLTYPEEFGIHKMFEVLEIKKLPHQQFLQHIINELKASSAGYRDYMRQRDGGDDPCSPYIKREPHPTSSYEPPARGSPDAKPHLDMDRAMQAAIASQLGASGSSTLGQGVLSPALSPAVDLPIGHLRDINNENPEDNSAAGSEPMDIDSVSDNDNPPVVEEQLAAPEGPLKKKRRVAPTLISSEPIHAQPVFAPTEGDAFTGRTTIFRYQAPPGWLGPGALTPAEILNSDEVDDSRTFAHGYQDHPPGRQRQVWGTLKRHSLSVRPHTTLGASQDEREESPLPLFGQSDDEKGMDSDTWEEFQQEEEERERMKALREQEAASVLSKDRVQAVLADVVKELEAQWVAEQQPKQDRKAHGIWESARRNPNREAYIRSIKKLKDKAVKRIPKFENQILMESWKSDEKLRNMASDFLEQSVFEKCYQSWLLGVLESPRCPPKLAALPRPTPRPKKQQELAEDEEDLASSESEMGDFLDDSDDKVMISSGWVQAEPSSDIEQEPDTNIPLAQSTPAKIKTERTLVPSTPSRPMTSTQDVIMIEDSPLVWPSDGLPEFTDRTSLEKMGEMGVDFWVKAKDAERLLAAILCEWTKQKRERLLKEVSPFGHQEVWEKYMKPVTDSDGEVARVGTTELQLCQLFEVFLDCSTARLARVTLRKLTLRKIEQGAGEFQTFYNHLKRVLVLFRTDKPLFGSRRSLAPSTPTKSPAAQTSTKSAPLPEESAEELVSQDPCQEGVSQDPAEATLTLADEVEAVLSDEEVPLSKKKRKRKQKVNQEAKNLRVTTQQQLIEFDRRRRRLHEEIAANGTVSTNMARLIVNETKEEDEPLIFINAYTGSKIKDHQIDGVRFMWNQVVVSRQGCLLAHTMGLGKTMQVITLLVVIAEAAASEDPAVVEQIPEKLRQSKTLILCPSGLVDNWVDEVNMWAPGGTLGPIYQVGSSLPFPTRVAVIKEWATNGGVLIIGYGLFGNLVEDEELEKLLQEGPNLVVGDEAHLIKNPNAKRSKAAAHFHTRSRIAMTGSPLTNNVMDYYAMINWVSPGYLSDIEEFRSRFGIPIRDGLYADSNASAKRQARKLLVILKETVSPKVHRRDVQVLRNELPTKKEFIIMLPLTPLQQTLYEIYIERVNNPTFTDNVKSSAQVWSMVAKLGLVLAHPKIFKTVAEKQKDDKGKAKGAKSGDEEEFILPQDILSELLTPTTCRDIDNDAHSYKIVALMFLLEEFRKVGDKALIFTQSIPALNFLESIFKRRKIRYQRLDGHTPINTRQASIKKFNSDDSADVYLISTKAGGVGLNIYGANRVIILDFKYSPTDEQQAIGRAYRLGQTKPVYVYWLMIGGTFEATIHKSAVFKTQLASRVIDKKNPAPYATRLKEYFVPPQTVDQHDLQDAYGQDVVLDALLNSDEVGHLVREVTSTETFEKEETYELPPEDQEEAKKEVELAFLRLRDPVAYVAEKARLDRERYGWVPQPVIQSNTMGMANPDFRNAQANLARNSVLPQLRDGFGMMVPGSSAPSPIPRHYLQQHQQVGRPNVAESAPPEVVDYRLPSTDLQPVLASGSFAKDPAEGQAATLPAMPLTTPQIKPGSIPTPPTPAPPPPALPTLAPPALPTLAPPNAAPPPPVPNSGPPTPALPKPGLSSKPRTQAASPISQQALLHAPVSATQQIPGPQPARPSLTIRPPASSTSAANATRPDFPELRQTYQTLCNEGKEVVYPPDAVMQGVEQALQEKGFGYEHLPAKDKWQNLQKCSRNARFAEAMLSGYIRPDQLVTRERKDLHAMVTRLNGLAEEDFKREVWGSQVNSNNQAARQEPRASTKVKDECRVSKVKKGKGKASGSTPKRPRESVGPRTPNIGPGPGGRQQAVRPGDSAASPFLID
ncbi:putative DNA repair and recombination protein RAD54-like protein [Cercophora samala]|uniref:DNA repair and recombination protein RAD54-like protein n=1 Tax=Cercophora samala TaxID=330535 RepID=A0AA39ZEE7_9PEZI|nr:putative DNA repair and recombination protein RAD54-like protein [Cercophora samala]